MRWRGAKQRSSKMYGRQQVQEESIYNLIPKTPEKPPKSERQDLDLKKYTTKSVEGGWREGGGLSLQKGGLLGPQHLRVRVAGKEGV